MDTADKIVRCSQKDGKLIFEIKWKTREGGI